MTSRLFAAGLASALGTGALAVPLDADACGCFAPPNPATPVVQAGEQIVFAQKDGHVTMHVLVQYSGAAEEFGWLLPLPSVPELEVGTESLFLELQARTRPVFRIDRRFDGQCQFWSDAGVVGGADAGSSPPTNGGGPTDVLVRREAVGPYDTAVLRADDQAEMLSWLNDNGFFVPDAIGAAVAPYIRPGGYFLALKLLSDRDAGDIAPIVLDYEAELPMIPMVLTQVGAEPDMPVTAYVLGEARAIPRNYRHTVLNLEHIDWFTGGLNYRDVVTAAVDEAEGQHSFVTEFAGATRDMVDVLDGPGRFGERETLAAITDPLAFVQALRNRNFTFTTTLVDILRDAYPIPQAVREAGFGEDQWYANLDWFLGPYREVNPEQFEGVTFEIDPTALTDAIWARIVEPARRAGQLFRDHPKMTRLFTTLSPEEMTKDPVFSFNPALPDVDNVHTATFTQRCEDGQPPPDVGMLELPDGRTFETTPLEWRQSRDAVAAPFSARIEILREEGAPEVEVDNSGRLTGNSGGGGGGVVGGGSLGRPGEASRSGCTCTTEQAGAGGGLAVLLLLALTRRRRA